MKYLTLAIAAASIITAIPSAADAKPRCKSYSKVISKNGFSEVASARVCRNNDDEWRFKKIRGSHHAQSKLAERIYNDLWNKGYGVLVDYIAPPNDYYKRDYRSHYRPYYDAHYTPHKHAKKHHKHRAKHERKYKSRQYYERCDD